MGERDITPQPELVLVARDRAASDGPGKSDRYRYFYKLARNQAVPLARGLLEARAEVERLRQVLRWTHETHCTSDWTDRGRHAPECLLYEIEEDDDNG